VLEDAFSYGPSEVEAMPPSHSGIMQIVVIHYRSAIRLIAFF
jgi:hypothetical protein